MLVFCYCSKCKPDFFIYQFHSLQSTKLNIWRCGNIANPDTCEHYMSNFVVKGVCEKINSGSENQIWVNAFKYVTPPMKCPVEPVSKWDD